MKISVYAFLIKRHLYRLDEAANLLRNLPTYQKELCLLFEKLGIFLQSEGTDRLDHLLPPVRFRLLFKDTVPPPPPTPFTTNFLNVSEEKNRNLEESLS